MREILFRAKRLDNGEWESGSLIGKGGSSYIFTYDYENHDELIGCPREEFLNFWKVDPDTVCQFTGLTDKNGVKIFEGDILGGGHLGFSAAVTFYDGMFQLVTSAHQGNSPLVQDRASRLKVLGNIFDNPELLTQ